jgi:hypothetical protein
VRRALVLGICLGAVAACRDSGPAHHVIVNTLAGERVEPNVTVVAHSPTGDVVDITAADATGRAQIGIEDDSLVSVVFPGTISNITPVISVITTEPPRDGSELTIHGPRGARTPPLIAGVLQLDGPNLNAADYFNVTLGCVTVRVDGRLPATIDVSSCNLGSDQNLDILVRGYHDAGTPAVPQLDGYAAGRATMTNGVATFTVPQWLTSGMPVAVTQMQSGTQAALTWTMHVDGLDFVSEPMSTTSFAFTGLVVDTTTVDALVPAPHGARITTRTFEQTPAAITLADSDFLPALDPVPAAPTVVPTTIEWTAATVAADALHVHATWTVGVKVTSVVPPGPHTVVWDAILPTDATSVTLPMLDGDLQTAIAPTGIAPSDVVLRAVDSSSVDGFAALVAAGIRAEETTQASAILEAPIGGQVRVAESFGTAQ